MLESASIAGGTSFALLDVRCSHRSGSWSDPELGAAHALVLARRGVFRRRVAGRVEVIDPNVAYFQCDGQEQQVAHPADAGDRCLSIKLSDALVSVLAGDDLPVRAFPTSPGIDWRSRKVCALAGEGLPVDDLEEDVVALVSSAVASARAEPRSQVPSRMRIVEQGREALAADPTLGLLVLADELGCSPDHLSRAFSQVAGVSFTRYRRRLRVRLALDRLAAGETQLARLAVSVGFADHAHLTRSTRAELGITPTHARTRLARRVAA